MGDPKKDEKTGQFVVGGGGRGRRRGARNRLHADFVVALQEHFAEKGQAAIEIVFREHPRDYLRVIVSVLPREFVLEDGRLESMGDEELAEYLTIIRRRLGAAAEQDRGDPGGGEDTTIN